MGVIADGATPLSPDEKEGLVVLATTRAELNVFEASNIAKAKLELSMHPPKSIVCEKFLRKLHKAMFGDVWSWAGKWRKTEKNIGCPAWRIPVDIEKMFQDVRFWIDNGVFDGQEIAIRLHHRIAKIHPFPNGNGRTARFMADLTCEKLRSPALSWGSADSAKSELFRKSYIEAMRKADDGDFQPLLDFCKNPRPI